jgi:hypothetical protein
MRFWPWAFTWFVCNAFGSLIVLLAWPKNEPATGLKFWSWIAGAPNGSFLILLGVARAGYETLWYRAYWRNHHRGRWLAERIRFARRPLYVLGVGYCLPLDGKSLSDVLTGKRSILKLQAPRHGFGKVTCNRFQDNDPLLAVAPDMVEGDAAEGNAPTEVAPAAQMIRAALEPLAASIQAFTRYESAYWPQVRVLAEPEMEQLRLSQVREALRLAGLAPLEVQAVPAADGLMVTDAWLDARERRPLLAVALSWYDDGIDEGRGEGCIAVLLDAGYFRLPSEVSRKAALHRPVAADATESEYGLANAAMWGKVDAARVFRAWITCPVEDCDRSLSAAGFKEAATDSAQYRLDCIVGDMRAANGLLAIAAALESGTTDEPLIVIDGPQSAILHLIPEDRMAPTHDDSQK